MEQGHLRPPKYPRAPRSEPNSTVPSRATSQQRRPKVPKQDLPTADNYSCDDHGYHRRERGRGSAQESPAYVEYGPGDPTQLHQPKPRGRGHSQDLPAFGNYLPEEHTQPCRPKPKGRGSSYDTNASDDWPTDNYPVPHRTKAGSRGTTPKDPVEDSLENYNHLPDPPYREGYYSARTRHSRSTSASPADMPYRYPECHDTRYDGSSQRVPSMDSQMYSGMSPFQGVVPGLPQFPYQQGMPPHASMPTFNFTTHEANFAPSGFDRGYQTSTTPTYNMSPMHSPHLSAQPGHLGFTQTRGSSTGPRAPRSTPEQWSDEWAEQPLLPSPRHPTSRPYHRSREESSGESDHKPHRDKRRGEDRRHRAPSSTIDPPSFKSRSRGYSAIFKSARNIRCTVEDDGELVFEFPKDMRIASTMISKASETDETNDKNDKIKVRFKEPATETLERSVWSLEEKLRDDPPMASSETAIQSGDESSLEVGVHQEEVPSVELEAESVLSSRNSPTRISLS